MKVFTLILTGILAVSLTGCSFQSGGNQVKHERTVELSEALETDKFFSAQTFNGAITVTENTTNTCDITATITARAATAEEAQLLAEATSIELEQTPDGLKTVINRPKKKNRESLSVKLDVRVPSQTALSLRTSNGAITINSMQKNVNATTSNGRIEVSNVTGNVTANTSNGRIDIRQSDAEKFDLHTSNGKICCEAIAGNIQASTSNGAIHIKYGSEAKQDTNINLHTSNGSITVNTPDNYSAKVDASTSNSKIHCNIPITVKGSLGKHIKGTIGSGEGQLTLKTSNGSITIN
ncbi:MAG: DUF4097 family beta strand repeat-containing protein [Planctomycetota bacterium]